MKNLKRAYRRHKQHIKFERRLDIYCHTWWSSRKGHMEELKNEIRNGKKSNFLRHTLNPCNCDMCSASNKFDRVKQKKIDKKIIKDYLT